MAVIAIYECEKQLREIAQTASDLMLEYLGPAWAQQDKGTKWEWKPIPYKKWAVSIYTDRINISWDSDNWVFNIDENLLDSVVCELKAAFPKAYIKKIPSRIPVKFFYENAFKEGKIKTMPKFPSQLKELKND